MILVYPQIDNITGSRRGLWVDKEEFISLFGGQPERIVWVMQFQILQGEKDDVNIPKTNF